MSGETRRGNKNIGDRTDTFATAVLAGWEPVSGQIPASMGTEL